MSDGQAIETGNIAIQTLTAQADLSRFRAAETSTEANLASEDVADGSGRGSTDGEIDGGLVSDALVGLVERAMDDPGAAFTPEALAAIVGLKKGDQPAFEVLRAQLKKAGCRVTALDEAIADEGGGISERAVKQADILVELAEEAELFHAPDRTAYADLIVNNHRETWPVKSKGFRHWILRRYYDVEEGAPGSAALQSALSVVEAKAYYDARERDVHLRVGGYNGRLYLDLCDENWRSVEIDAAGWRVLDRPPVRFRRAAGMQPLPSPEPGGSIETLRSFLNLKSDGDFVLVVSWLLAALRDRGPYPVIALSGEQGSAKSTFTGIVRSVLDPNTAPLRALPREDRDLFIAANNGHVLAFDNVSGLPAWMSDTFCRLATGGGFALRQLYTDQDEVLFDAAKPVILNGIEDFVTRPDLADRALFLTLEPITEARRRPEDELRAAFRIEQPRILGVLLDGVVRGLNRLPHTKLEKLPRMADFAKWAAACESAFWPSGTFVAAYQDNRDEAVDNVIDADPVASTIRTMMGSRSSWTGTASELLLVLLRVAGERDARSKSSPQTPRALASRLRRAVTFLRKIGIEVTFSREGRGRVRIIHIVARHLVSAGDDESGSSASAAPSSSDIEVLANRESAVSTLQPVSKPADGSADASQRRNSLTVRASALKNSSAAVVYHADASSPSATPVTNVPPLGWTRRI